MDLRLTNDDMDLTNGELSLVQGPEAIGQHIKMRIQAWYGELGLVYDQSAGVPYLGVIFGQRNPNMNAIQAILESRIRGTPGVISVSLELVLYRTTRTLQASGKATTIDGNVDFSELIEVAA
jgi:hypothetical protein